MTPQERKEYREEHEYLLALWEAVLPKARLLDFLYSTNDGTSFTTPQIRDAITDLEVDRNLRYYLQKFASLQGQHEEYRKPFGKGIRSQAWEDGFDRIL